MEYQIIKVYNNNVVLAQQNGEQVVLVSKGIGFGKKIGDTLKNDGSIEKVFYELSPNDSKSQLKNIQQMDEQINYVIKEFINIAKDKLGSLGDTCEEGIREHIEFAMARLEMGLAIENPFLNEISTLYKAEYQIAGIARELIKSRLNIDIGDGEQGFIALHLYAAKTRKTVKETIKLTRIYAKCIEIIEKEFDIIIPLKRTVTKLFISNLKVMVGLNREGKKTRLSIKEHIRVYLPQPYQAAKEVAQYLYEEKNISFSEDEIAYLAIAIEQMIQSLELNTVSKQKKQSESIKNACIADSAQAYVEQLGGKANIMHVDACATRLRVILKDKQEVSDEALKKLGCTGIFKPTPNVLHMIIGMQAEELAEKIKKYIESKEE